MALERSTDWSLQSKKEHHRKEMATYGEWKSSRSWYSYTSKKSLPWALDRRFTAVRFHRAARSRLPCSSSPSCSWVLTDPYPTLLLSRSGTSLPAPRWGSWVSLSSVERRASPLQSGESSARWSAVCSSWASGACSMHQIPTHNRRGGWNR